MGWKKNPISNFGERRGLGRRGRLSTSAEFEKHLAELRERQAAVGGPRAYWQIQQNRVKHRADKERRREVNAFIRLVKWNMKYNPEFWE